MSYSAPATHAHQYTNLIRQNHRHFAGEWDGRRRYVSPVNHALRVLLPIAALLCGCEHRPTRAELERDVLRTTFAYYYEQRLEAEDRAEFKLVFVGTPGEWDEPKGRPLIQTMFRDPSPAWQAALASTGIPIRPASQAAYVGTEAQPWYHDPTTGARALVFAILDISFSDDSHASVHTSSACAPLAGGEMTFVLARESGSWRVTEANYGVVY